MKTVKTTENSSASQSVPDIVLSTSDGQELPGGARMTVYINRGCHNGSVFDIEKINNLPSQIGPGSLHHVLREVLQQLVNCSLRPFDVFKRIEPGTPRVISITAESNGKTHVRAIPIAKNAAEARTYLRDFLSRNNVCSNFVSHDLTVCLDCAPISEHSGSSHNSWRSHDSGESDDLDAENGSGSSSQSDSPLCSWSVGRLAAHLESFFGIDIANRFSQNEIDGRAVQLMTTSLLINNLGMTLGPALKLMSHIESLKVKYSSPTNYSSK